ncbi:hypothetical protein ASC61_15855 [Aeromicrobium sp. Root344]|uniref:RDD family protein n=1 Tax=Aeromicrobium sp. Root344 TaxID=1736521 RepID=UPI000700E1E2|nr:RDD family protein [Aeromicrobium sp. Root344]KQV76357.1 hypothetical protein ASC61_15855 [Aeromicrobium sp. Root344]
MADYRTIRQLRREALGHDALLFSAAFSAGALLYFLGRAAREALTSSGSSDFWTISLSDDLILSGLIVGELFLVWNNGLRQGLRGHSIGKHRVGLAVVDVGDEAPTGAGRGILRGLVMAVLLDLAVAAIPIGLPTTFRRLTPDSWHFGGAAYLALIVLVVPLLLSSDRGFADRVARTKVVRASGAGATTTAARQRILTAMDIAGVIGLLAVAIIYIAYYSPLLKFPDPF